MRWALTLLALFALPGVAVGQIGWTVGGNGNIFKSTDAGTTWTGAFPTTALLNSVYFLDSMTGYVAGGQVILKTTTGGGTAGSWTDTYTGGGALNSVFFINSTSGWAVGNTGVITKTTNGGTTWTDIFPVSATLNSVYFLDSNNGYVAGGQVILKTTTGGATVGSWADTYNGGGVLNSVFFINSTTGWAVGNTGIIAKTTNSGSTWTEIFPVSTTLNSVYFINSTTGWAAGGQVILKTTTGGATVGSWTDKYTGGADIQSVYFLDAMSGWAVGSNGTILKSTNGGETWTEQVHPTTATLESVIFVQAPTVPVTVNTSPAGRSFTVDGTTYSTSQNFNWIVGSSHTIATTSLQAGSPGTQYVWANWSDGGAISHMVAPTVATTYTANFNTQYQLTMMAGAGGSVSPSSGYRNSGTSVSITATPSAGFSFSAWTGSGSGSYSGPNNPAMITMNGPITETASFVANVSVTVQTSPAGRSFSVDGNTYSTTQMFSWTPGSAHTIATTSPQSGGIGTQYLWSVWSDGGAISHQVIPASNTTYTASFNTQHFLTMSAGAGGVVTPSSGWQNASSVVQIAAIPDAGQAFTAWAGSGSGSYTGPNNPASVTMNGPVAESATFTASQPQVAVACPADTTCTPLQMVQLEFGVANSGSGSGTIDYSYDDTAGWLAAGSGTLILGGGASSTVSVQIVAEAGSYSDSSQVHFRAVVREAPSIADSCVVDLSVPRVSDVGFVPAAPGAVRLLPATPNPFNPEVTISFDVPKRVPLELAVYTVTGRRVSTLYRHESPLPGRYAVIWRGASEDGRPQPSGVYVVRLGVGSIVRTQRVVLIK